MEPGRHKTARRHSRTPPLFQRFASRLNPLKTIFPAMAGGSEVALNLQKNSFSSIVSMATWRRESIRTVEGPAYGPAFGGSDQNEMWPIAQR
jgi:hypothetical protein